MTILAAIQSQIPYPLSASFYEAIMLKRGIENTECTKGIMESAPFKGAMADCIKQIILYPSSISEGGMSISKTDRDSLLYMGNKLYEEIGEDPIGEKPKITFY